VAALVISCFSDINVGVLAIVAVADLISSMNSGGYLVDVSPLSTPGAIVCWIFFGLL
jgi:hypothetical protein